MDLAHSKAFLGKKQTATPSATANVQAHISFNSLGNNREQHTAAQTCPKPKPSTAAAPRSAPYISAPKPPALPK